jgi:ribosome biogenesis GTPase / thiamine phosphate phosphatase
MSKRRINQQQAKRIEKQQWHHRQPSEIERDDTTSDGLVITRYSRHAHVEDSKGSSVHCAIRPNIDSLVAGDRVVWQAEGKNQGIIISRYPRETVLGRPDNKGHLRPIAANISQIMIVVAAKPEISWELLDSYLVMAEYLKLHPYIILNKVDLPCDDIRQALLKHYEPLGYPMLFTSQNASDQKLLQNSLNNQVSVFVGQSGVGKSSLILGILPHESARIQTGDISAHSELGCHTTSNSHYYHLPSGGAIIDSPGVRELSLWHMSGPELAKGYREFKPYLTQCKFRNCTHYDTPGCAITNAVKNKLISLKRYENYVKMLQNLERNP